MHRRTRSAAVAGLLALSLGLGLGACRESRRTSGRDASAPASSVLPGTPPTVASSSASPAPPPYPGDVVLDHLGDPELLTSDGHSLYWVDAQARTLDAWSAGDGGAARVVTDFVAPIGDLVQPFTVAGGFIHLLTQIDGESKPRVERVATSGGPRKVLSNAIPSVLGVAVTGGHVLVALDVDPPERSMLGEVSEVGADRKLTTLGRTNGQPRALAVRQNDLFVASAVGLSRHRPNAKADLLTAGNYCGPAMTTDNANVYFARADRPAVAAYGKDAREFALRAFPVALAIDGSSLYVGMRESRPTQAADAGADADADVGRVPFEQTLMLALRDADESMSHRRAIRAIARVDLVDGKITPVASFDPPATSFAIVDHALYVASPLHGGAIHRVSPP